MQSPITISVIEFDYHAEVLINTLEILKNINNLKIQLFVSDNVWRQLKESISPNDNINVYTASSRNKIKPLINLHLPEINNSQAIFFNTIASNFRLFCSIEFTAPVILRIHNANTYFNPIKSINPKLSLFYLWKDTSYIVLHVIFKLETIYRSRFVRQKVDFFQFPSEIIEKYAITHNYLKADKLFPTIPYVFMKELLPKNKSEATINIAILGGIDKRRRNYNEVYTAFLSLSKTIKKKVHLSLVGRPRGIYGKKVVKKFKKLENENLKVTTFNSFIPQSEFETITSNVDFLIIPTVREARFKLYKELYGYTKISGNINDMIVYQKPAIVPSFYPLEDSLAKHTEAYKDETDLVNVLKKWIDEEKYKEHEFREIIYTYSFETIVQRTQNGLKEIIKTGV